MKRILLLILFFVGSHHFVSSQENFASNIITEISEDEKLLITYDIKANANSKSFSVILILTENGNKINASSVYGDIGSNIAPGVEKAIVWYFKNDFEGNINDVNIDIFAYKENEPQAIFKIVSTSNNGYAPCELTFSNNSSYANEYQWDFDDAASGSNNISFNKEPSHIFEKGGVYSIALTARNTQLELENTYYQSIEIKEHKITTADFEIQGNNQTPPAKIKFINKSVNADTYKWNFGDPGSKKKNKSDKTDVDHKFDRAGIYMVELSVKNDFSGITDKISKEVTVVQKLTAVANFTYSKSTETAPATVAFKNTSTSASKYEWDFGDPASDDKNHSTDTNPAHVYTKAGNYTVQLLAFSTGNKKPVKFSQEIVINELPKPPVANFTIDNNNVLGPATIIFKNNSVNATAYSWNFGDPESGNKNTSDKTSPTHTYKNAGKYKVELLASHKDFKEKNTISDFVIIIGGQEKNANTSTSNTNKNTETTSDEVVVDNEQAKSAITPIANFKITNKGAMAPATISFKSSSLDANSFIWDFGDPESTQNASTSESTKHTYTKSGKYAVTLSVKNKKSGLSDSFTDYVTVAAPAVQPIAAFQATNSGIPAPAEITFSNNSSNADKYVWDFGDPQSSNNSSNEANPRHTYNKDGKYTVTLTVSNNSSGLSNSASGEVQIAEKLIQPVANFEMQNNEVPAPSEIMFTNQSDNADKYEWDFGDSNSENNSSAVANPKHLYNKVGKYRVTLKVTNNNSKLSHTTNQLVTITAPLIHPVANFEIENTDTDEPATIVFKNTSTEADTYIWNFSDKNSERSNSSTLVNPQHIFEKAGEYKVSLTAKNTSSGIENIFERIITITKPSVPLKANFEIIINGNTAPASVTFKNLSASANSYKWNFGDFESDFNISNDESPNHHFEKAGDYKITLEAKNPKTGEVDKATQTITLKSSSITFIKSAELAGNFERAYSVVQSAENEYMVAISGDKKQGSSIVNIKGNGTAIKEQKFNTKIYNIIPADNNNFQIVGIDGVGNLFIQNLDSNLKTGASVILQESKNYKTDFAVPKLAHSATSEVGVIANTIDDKYPISVVFQKTNKSGKKVPLIDRTFKYVGTKLATDIIPTEDGGFALTGYWKEKSNTPMLILFGRIDRKGRGEMDLISSSLNILGYDIEESYQGGYAVLRAKENDLDNKYYEISFILIDSEGGPTDCANLLPCTIKKEDVLKYEPAMRKTNNGYVIASHTFNGENYNIILLWIDKTGNELIRYEEIPLPNDQFVMDFVETSDGGFLIAGTEKVKGEHKALLLKTDKYGKINQ